MAGGRRTGSVTSRCLALYCLVHLCHVSLACILLLNGWTPLSVLDRAALADIVAAGEVLRTFKDVRTEHGTFTAEVKLFTVHKGLELLRRANRGVVVPDASSSAKPSSSSSSSSSSLPLSSSSSITSYSTSVVGEQDSDDVGERRYAGLGGRPGSLTNSESARYVSSHVYNVSNFGDKAMCYADVTAGEVYLFFLTLYDGGLSAKYDDIFGAAADYTQDNERQVLDYLGWYPWSDWSPCSHSCGEGLQSRTRTCSRDNVTLCEGSDVDSRHCNTFSCSDVVDLLSKFGVPKLPFGVTRSDDVDRQGAYVISTQAKLFVPVSTLYDPSFPLDFALIMSLKRRPAREGYVLVLSDISGRQRVAVFLGENLRFEYQDDPSRTPAMVRFDVSVEKDKWHNMALRVQGRQVVLYFDCVAVVERKLRRGDNSWLGNNLMLSVGPYFANHGPAFEGEVEQLVLSDDPTLAERQCFFQTEEYVGPVKDDNNDNGSGPSSLRTTRAPPKSTPATSTPQPKPASCRQPCLNGGTCLSTGVCRCPTGYHGNACQSPVCAPGCQHGGVCVAPGICQCPRNFSGSACETPVCDPPCLNGGLCLTSLVCACPYGYSGDHCQPYCKKDCLNGGLCVRPDHCRCPKGYSGKFCQQPECRRGCSNGGKCVAPDQCKCPSGFKGNRCQKPRCRPSCKKGGKCVAPNLCLCAPDNTLARKCKINKCKKKCQNGGQCGTSGNCVCKFGFYGLYCQKQNCNLTCLNGGRCRRHKNTCRCPPGFYGRRCERRSCLYEQYEVPYRKTYRRTVREDVLTRCGPWTWKSCVKTVVKYITVAKESYRTAYRCV